MADLRDELLTDPLGWGYNGVGIFNVGPGPMTDQEATDVLNTIHPSPNTRTRDRTSMSGRQVRAEVVNAEYDALPADKKSQFLALTASGDLDPFGLGANIIKDIFGGGSVTLGALQIARVESITRAQELGLSIVKPGHVEAARTT